MKASACFVLGFAFMHRQGLRQYIWLPLIANALIYGIGIWALLRHFSSLMNRFLPPEAWYSFLYPLLWPLIAIMLVLIVFYSFSLLANLIAAPFNSFLSAAVEAIDSGRSPQTGMSLGQEIWHSIVQEIRKTYFFLLWAIPILLTGFVPLLNLLTPFLWLIYAAWASYLQYMDYPMANNGIFFSQQRPILCRRYGDMLGFGGVASLLLMIPLVNLIAMPLCVIAATLHWTRHIRPSFPNEP